MQFRYVQHKERSVASQVTKQDVEGIYQKGAPFLSVGRRA